MGNFGCDFFSRVTRATNEDKEINPAYTDEIVIGLKNRNSYNDKEQIEYGKTDGIIPAKYCATELIDGVETEILKPFFILLECKLKGSFESSSFRGRTLLQVVCYLKQRRETGAVQPLVAILGSQSDCFIVLTSCLEQYVLKEICGYESGSTAYTLKENSEILRSLESDENILQNSSLLYKITSDFKVQDLVDASLSFAKNEKLNFKITEKNISTVFDYFTTEVLRSVGRGDNSTVSEKVDIAGNLVSVRDQQQLFMSILLGMTDVDIKKKDGSNWILWEVEKPCRNIRYIRVNRDKFLTFEATYKLEKYSVEAKKHFSSICDRLIENVERRNKGDFYTPAVWVDEAHKIISSSLGDDWKEKYVVWDCACGTKNLTRDYKFKRLYSSSIEHGDIEISKKYNKSIGDNQVGVAWQYDFLNDDVDVFELARKKKEETKGYVLSAVDFENSYLSNSGLGLLTALLNKEPIVFFINPPYGTATNKQAKIRIDDTKQGIAKNKVNDLMLKTKMGKCSQNLYAQFIYRILQIIKLFELDNVVLALYSKGSLLTSSSYTNLREELQEQLSFNTGMMFNASEFSGCKSSWGIYFTLWGNTPSIKHTTVFPMYVKEFDKNTQEVNTLCVKEAYSLKKHSTCSEWCKQNNKNLKVKSSLQLASGLKFFDDALSKKARGTLLENSLGYYVNLSNTVEGNNQDVYLLSSCSRSGNGISVLPENFYRVISNFTARKLISGKYANWKNDKDEYMIPNITHYLYKQWEADCLVYSLFNSSSAQTSLRDVSYDNHTWNIINEWFFMGYSEMQELASGMLYEDVQSDLVEEDLTNFPNERYIYTQLTKVTLSEDAQLVLDAARDLVRKSFKYRENFEDSDRGSVNDPDKLFLNTWDAGWYQLKYLLREQFQDDLKAFNVLYRNLEDRMRPLVYEFGFLKK